MFHCTATHGQHPVGRPTKSLISRDKAIRAALKVIDTEGLDGFSLGAVARRLKVKSPSLYYYFSDKAELLAEVARQMLLDVRYPDASVGGWEERVIALCVATRQSLLTHPNAAPLLLQFFPRHLLLGAYENAVKGYPFTRDVHLTILEGLEKLTIGSALFEASARARNLTSMPEVDAASYPNLAKSVAANPFADEALFVEAVRMFLAGIKTRTARSRKKASPAS